MSVAGACHCGTVRFDVRLTDGIATARRCDCSYCAMRGAVAVSAKIGDITFVPGEDVLTRYTFNTDAAEHFFCRICGIYTHHRRRRSSPDQFGVNLSCLEGYTPFLPCVDVMDGRNHPRDSSSSRVAGTLRFEEAP